MTKHDMKHFAHMDATSFEEAAQNAGADAVIIAGGTDLLGTLKDEILPTYPKTVVNIKTVADGAYITEDGDMVRIGALTKVPAAQIEEYRRLHPACEVEDTLYEGSEATWRFTDLSGTELAPRYALLREQFGYDELAYSVFWLDPYYEEDAG